MTAGKDKPPVVSGAAFDAFAPDYDAGFTGATLGRLLRRRVWDVLDRVFQPGQHVLELACGTGEDAVWLAKRGVRVTATDGSPRMLEVAQAKAEAAGVADLVTFTHSDLYTTALDFPAASFDGALSNFGGLNVLSDWRPLAAQMAVALRPGAAAVLIPMGPVCPWETAWHLGHLDPATALRRQRPPAIAVIGDARVPIWYPAARRLRRDFAPWFESARTESLGLWLPPSYLGHLVDRHTRLFGVLARIEQRTARLTGGWGDHYILVLLRRHDELVSAPRDKSFN